MKTDKCSYKNKLYINIHIWLESKTVLLTG